MQQTACTGISRNLHLKKSYSRQNIIKILLDLPVGEIVKHHIWMDRLSVPYVYVKRLGCTSRLFYEDAVPFGTHLGGVSMT